MKNTCQCIQFLALLTCPQIVSSQNTYEVVVPFLTTSSGSTSQRTADDGIVTAAWGHDRFSDSGLDIVLLRFNDQGDTLWTRAYGTPFDDHVFSLLTTSDGGFLIIGATASDLDPERISAIKTDALGDTLWTRTYRWSGGDFGRFASECVEGGYLIVSHSYGAGIFITRISAQGDIIWTRRYDRHDPPDFQSQFSASAAIQSADSSFLVIGQSAISKVNPDGSLEWTKAASGNEQILFEHIVHTTDGGVALLGHYGINQDYLLVKMDSQGDMEWSKAYGSAEGEWSYCLLATSDHGFAMTGVTQRPDPSSSDAYVIKTDSVGVVQFSHSFGGSGWDAGRDIIEMSDGSYVLVGHSSSFLNTSSSILIRTDSLGAGSCYQDSVETVVTDVDLTWTFKELSPFSAVMTESPMACSLGRGATVVPLCTARINELNDAEFINTFPNPAHDQFTLSLPLDRIGSLVEFFNAIGDRVVALKAASSQTTIDCSALSRGIYLVKVTSVTATTTQRIVLE